MLNNFICITAIALLACSSQVKDRSDKNIINTGSAFQDNQNTAQSAIDSIILAKNELTKLYSQAIADYIKAVYQKDKIVFDTLFFGKHVYGQADDFPDITLPEKIENTQIRLVNPEAGLRMQKARKSLVYINMIALIDEKKAEFILVAFSNGCEHQFDCYIDYKYNNAQKEFELEKSRIEALIRNKAGTAEHYAIYENGKYVGNKPIDGNKH